jgi:hypothetical protein
MRRFIALTYKVTLYIFAGIGIATTGVFFAMRYDLLDVRGGSDDRNQYFLEAYREQQAMAAAAKRPPGRTARITSATEETPVEDMTVLENSCIDTTTDTCSWDKTTEWAVISAALLKDSPVLNRVEVETGVPARLIAAVVVPEQARFFSSNREVFKRWFEPMKLLGSLSQFSLGVSGIKQETAEQIEVFANDPTSTFYPGVDLAQLVAYEEGSDTSSVLFDRLTNEDDHYYSYLYTALFIKEVMMQWQRAGFGEELRPEIIVTLFNLGFSKSVPKADPTAGGASLQIGGTDYTYGTLGGLFYYSEELREVFPVQS